MFSTLFTKQTDKAITRIAKNSHKHPKRSFLQAFGLGFLSGVADVLVPLAIGSGIVWLIVKIVYRDPK